MYFTFLMLFGSLGLLHGLTIIGGNQLALFWGSNSATKIGKQEGRLKEYCSRRIYNTIILQTLSANPKGTNKNDLPSLNFANHCNDNPLKDYNNYIKCPQIEADIQFCQSKGIRVLLDIGGSTRWFGFYSKQEAELFAIKVYNLFLGGVSNVWLRTFGSVVLDGVNLSLRTSQQLYTTDFVRALRRIMDSNGSRRRYIMTASSRCVTTHVDPLTPTFKNLIAAFDTLYVSFSDGFCTLNNIPSFNATLQTWLVQARKPNGPGIYIGISASDRQPNAHFVHPDNLSEVYRVFSTQYPEIKGIVLNDASFDKFGGGKYSTSIREILDSAYTGVRSPTKSPTSPPDNQQTQVPQRPVITRRQGKKHLIVFGSSGTSKYSSSTWTAILVICTRLFFS